ncbi:hypothetical protein [Anatilimnocola floriformis]|uniref:hypothetical protein n=1 Tax=Anatilimnocola floriformis TaxID=2948575 RepID=UPI0020C4F086|nr:hypothetical protein [Anatilimnocola floriformis]
MAKYVSEKPKHAVTIHTYKEFREDVRRFADGKFNFLIVIGTAGLGKTETVKEQVEDYVEFSGGCRVECHTKIQVARIYRTAKEGIISIAEPAHRSSRLAV